MAVTPGVIYSALIANRASGIHPLLGPNFETLALAIGNSVAAWAVGQPLNVALAGVAAGASGGGTIAPPTTRIVVPPTVSIMLGALSGAGFNGPMMPSLATVVTLGISQAFTTSGQYAGTVTGVGSGQDVSKVVVSNPSTLIPLLLPLIGTGPAAPQLATGLANGIAGLLLQGTGTGTVVGSSSPPAASGVSVSVII